MGGPLVSIIVPAYNAERFLEKTLDSVRAQTYGNFETFIVDDGSTDRTPEIAGSFCAKDSRFSLLRQEHLGVSAARNLAIEKAGGTFIAPLDADDLWFPRKIQRQLELMHEGVESIGIVFSRGFIIDECDSIIAAVGSPCALNSFYNFVYANSIGRLGSPLIRKECLKKVGLYDTRFVDGGEDWNLYIRISREFSVACTPDYLVGYRRVTGSMSSKADQMNEAEKAIVEATATLFPDIPKCLLRWAGSALDFAHGRRLLERRDWGKAVIHMMRSFAFDPLRLLYPFGLLNYYRRHVVEVHRWLSEHGLARKREIPETTVIAYHRASLTSPSLFDRLHQRRISRLAARQAAGGGRR